MIGKRYIDEQQGFTRDWKRAVSGFFLLAYPLCLNDKKIASSTSRSPWPSATQNPAGGRTIKDPRSHARSCTRVAANVPTKVAPPDFRSPFDDDVRTLSLPPVRRGFALHLVEPHGAPPVPHSHPEGAHLRSSPPGSRDTPRGRVSSLRPPAHDIRPPPRDQCTRTSCSNCSSRECVQRATSSSTHARDRERRRG